MVRAGVHYRPGGAAPLTLPASVRLPDELVETALPLVAETGRLRLARHRDDDDPPPLAFDGGALGAGAGHQADDDGAHHAVVGQLAGGVEVAPLAPRSSWRCRGGRSSPSRPGLPPAASPTPARRGTPRPALTRFSHFGLFPHGGAAARAGTAAGPARRRAALSRAARAARAAPAGAAPELALVEAAQLPSPRVRLTAPGSARGGGAGGGRGLVRLRRHNRVGPGRARGNRRLRGAGASCGGIAQRRGRRSRGCRISASACWPRTPCPGPGGWRSRPRRSRVRSASCRPRNWGHVEAEGSAMTGTGQFKSRSTRASTGSSCTARVDFGDGSRRAARSCSRRCAAARRRSPSATARSACCPRSGCEKYGAARRPRRGRGGPPPLQRGAGRPARRAARRRSPRRRATRPSAGARRAARASRRSSR